MDKNNNKRSIMDNSKNIIFGYSIEYGNTTYQDTLEERIQAARAVSSTAKQTNKHNVGKEKLFSNNRKTTIQNTTLKNTINIVPNLQKKIKPYFPSSVKINTESNNNASNIYKSTCKECPMQRRLESIKAKNVLTNTSKINSNEYKLVTPKYPSSEIWPNTSIDHYDYINNVPNTTSKLKQTIISISIFT